MADYRKVYELKIDDIFSTINNIRTIYIVKNLKRVKDNVELVVNVLDFQTMKFDNFITKKYPSNKEITMRTKMQVLNRIFTGSISGRSI